MVALPGKTAKPVPPKRRDGGVVDVSANEVAPFCNSSHLRVACHPSPDALGPCIGPDHSTAMVSVIQLHSIRLCLAYWCSVTQHRSDDMLGACSNKIHAPIHYISTLCISSVYLWTPLPMVHGKSLPPLPIIPGMTIPTTMYHPLSSGLCFYNQPSRPMN